MYRIHLPVRAFIPVIVGLALTTSTAAEFRLIDDGTGTRQVVVDGPTVYALKENGNIWAFHGGRWDKIDDGSGTKMIAADEGRIWALKENGRLWRRAFGSWSAVAMKGSRQIAVAGKDLYTLETNDEVWFFNSRNGGWARVDDGRGTRMITADVETGLYVLKNNGNIFHHQGQGRFDLVDDGSGTLQIAASGGILYSLKNNGNVWRRHGGNWQQIDDGTGTSQIAPDGSTLFCLKNNGNVWMFRDESWDRVDDGTGTRQIEARDGVLVVLKENGNIYLAGSDDLAGGHRSVTFRRLHGLESPGPR